MANITVAYSAKSLDGKTTIGKSQTQDTLYGIPDKEVKQTGTPFLLGILKDSKYLMKEEALVELNKPIWGPLGDTPFYELLPVIPPKVPQNISTPDGNYPWIAYDKDDQSTWPTYNPVDINPAAHGNAMYWEGEDHQNRLSQGGFMSYENASLWGLVGIYRYRRCKQEYESVVIPNPDYPIVEAERAAKTEELTNVVKSTLIPMGAYQFQSLPVETKSGYTPYTWKVNGVSMKPTYDFWLASATGGWIFIYSPMRNPETMTTKNANGQVIIKNAWEENYSRHISGVVNVIVDPAVPDVIVRKLLNVV